MICVFPSHRELESDITALIRNSGRNDGWPAAFKSHVGDREGELVERVRTRVADLYALLSLPATSPLPRCFFCFCFFWWASH